MKTLSTRSLVVLCAGLVVVTCAVLINPKPASERPRTAFIPAAAGDAYDLRSVQDAVDQNRRDTDALRKVVGNFARTNAPGPAPEHDQAAVAQSANTAPQPTREQILAHIQAEFAAESGDPSWNPGAELQGKVEKIMPPGSKLRGLECRRSMCRMETTHKDVDSYNQFAHEFLIARLDQPLWTGATTFDVRAPERPGDDVRAVGYLGRNDLPSVGN